MALGKTARAARGLRPAAAFRLFLYALILFLLLSFAHSRGYIGNSLARIKREHGLRLPASASLFVCGGDAWLPALWPGCGAASAFEIRAPDLPAFLSQLQILYSQDAAAQSIFPWQSRYHIQVPWPASASAAATYHCDSPTGDSLDVQVRPLPDSRVGICLFTAWN